MSYSQPTWQARLEPESGLLRWIASTYTVLLWQQMHPEKITNADRHSIQSDAAESLINFLIIRLLVWPRADFIRQQKQRWIDNEKQKGYKTPPSMRRRTRKGGRRRKKMNGREWDPLLSIVERSIGLMRTPIHRTISLHAPSFIFFLFFPP